MKTGDRVQYSKSFLPIAIQRIDPLLKWGRLREEINNALNTLRSMEMSNDVSNKSFL